MKNINKKIIIATGGTGGHIFPAISLMLNLSKEGYLTTLTSDMRGKSFIEKYHFSNVKIINVSSMSGNKIIFFFKMIYSIFQSFILLTLKRPKFIIGMGGYASFPLCFVAIFLRIPFFIYENNLYLGKANKYLLPFSKKIFLAHSATEGIKIKYKKKIEVIGNILREEIYNFKREKLKEEQNKLTILVLGGSQAAKIFAEKLPGVFLNLRKIGIRIKIYQQCLPYQNLTLEQFYKKNDIEHELFNFSFDIVKYYRLVNLVVSRAGSSALSELIYCNLPIISIPLSSAADNHQLKNAKHFESLGLAILLEENQIQNKLFQLLQRLHKDKSITDTMIIEQKKYSDKKVFEKLNNKIKDYFYEN